MANATTTTADVSAGADNSIEALLQRRAQYEQWLARLESAAEKAPGVRERVRADYQARLDRVIDELRSHSATIARELEHHRTVERRLDAERHTAEEALAEAEVRHLVGEYGDDEWQRLSGESERRLAGLRQELDAVGAEIARLAEVQTLIASPSRTAALSAPTAMPPAPSTPAGSAPAGSAPAASAPAAPTPVQMQGQLEIEPTPIPVAATPTPVAQPVTPTPTPIREPEPEPVAEPSPVDELAFLKSVSDDERKPTLAPSSHRSGGAGPTPAAAKAPEPAAAPAPSMAPTAPAMAGTGTAKAGMAKTLKCNECGTFNRPTEWYCERCGAELAAL